MMKQATHNVVYLSLYRLAVTMLPLVIPLLSTLLLSTLPTTWATLLLLTTTRLRVTLKFPERLLGMLRLTVLLLLKLVPSALSTRPPLSRVRSPTLALLVLPTPKLFVLVSRSTLVLPSTLPVSMRTPTSLVSPSLSKTRHINHCHMAIVGLQDIHNEIKISQFDTHNRPFDSEGYIWSLSSLCMHISYPSKVNP